MPTPEELESRAAAMRVRSEAAVALRAEMTAAITPLVARLRAETDPEGSLWEEQAVHYLTLALDILEFGRELGSNERVMLAKVEELGGPELAAQVRRGVSR